MYRQLKYHIPHVSLEQRIASEKCSRNWGKTSHDLATRHPHVGKDPSLWAGSTVSVAQLKCRNKIQKKKNKINAEGEKCCRVWAWLWLSYTELAACQSAQNDQLAERPP